MEVEKKGGGSFPSNYVTIHQLKQRWLQQQLQSPCSSSPVISESNHRDDDVESCGAKKPQNDAVSAHSPPPTVTKSPSYNNKKKASSANPNNQQPISSSGGSKKKPQNDAVSPPAKSPPPSSQQNHHHHHNEIVSKTLNQSVGPPHFRRGRNPNRLLGPQKPKPKPTDNVVVTLNTDSAANDEPICISKKKKTRKPKRVLPETDPKPELEESRELGGRRKSNNKAGRESKMDMVEKREKPRDKKAVREFKPKRESFGQYNDGAGAGAGAEVDKVVGDVVKENSRRGSGRLGPGPGPGKLSLKPASFDHDQDMNETAVNESDNINVTGVDGGSNWRRGSGRLCSRGIRRPLYSKPLIGTRKAQVWVKKGESTTPN